MSGGARRPALLLALAGCASQSAPPGGPPDVAPPLLVRTSPDSNAVNARPGRVTFRFDEVVAERPAGATSLGALFVVSPRAGDAEVTWRRQEVTVRPRRGFAANTVYTVTLLPGLADLRGNVRPDGAQLVFSTGATIPRTRIGGVVFDWATGQPSARALVHAVPAGAARGARDTVTYVAVADSTGRFVFRHLPPGGYTVRGAVDANNSRTIDPRELYDSTAVTLRDSATLELLAFAHDTVGPRLSTVEVSDSVTLRATFDKPLLPAQPLAPTLFRVTAADSTRIPVAAVTRAEAAAGAAGDSSAPAGSLPPGGPPAPRTGAAAPGAAAPGAAAPGAGPDATPALPAPRPSRPSPVSVVNVRVATPLRPGVYRVEAVSARNLLGVARTSDRTVEVERPRPAAAAPPGRPATPPAARTAPRRTAPPRTPPRTPARP